MKVLPPLVLLLATAGCTTAPDANDRAQLDLEAPYTQADGQTEVLASEAMQIYFLEIVTRDVEAVCAAYQRTHDVTFGDPVPELGNARTAEMPGGGLYSVRAPMGEVEEPVVRPYMLVEDIEAATAAAVQDGAVLAHPPLELPGYGTFSIYILGDNHFGLWQRP